MRTARLLLVGTALAAALPAIATAQNAYFRFQGGDPVASGPSAPPAAAGTSVPGTGELLVAAPASLRGAAGQPVAMQLARPANATGSVTWSSVGAPLPAGLYLSPAGYLSGRTSPVSGLAFQATDSAGNSGTTAPVSIVVGAPSVSLASSATVLRRRVGDTLSIQGVPSGLAGAAIWTLSGATGALPAGIGFDPGNALVGGTATGPGTATFTLALEDGADGATARSPEVTLDVAPPLRLALPSASVSAHVGDDLATGTPIPSGIRGQPSYALSVPAPDGMAFSEATGILSGRPASAFALSGVTLTATDPWDGAQASASLDVAALPPIAFQSQPSPIAAKVGDGVDMRPAVANGVAPVAYALLRDGVPAPGALAPCDGLTFSQADGGITGTPRSECAVTGLSVRATDAGGMVATSSPFAVTLTLDPTATLTLPSQVRSGAVSGTVSTNLPSPTWAFQSSPSGWSFAVQGGTLSATAPTVLDATPATVVATATGGGRQARSATQAVTLNPPLSAYYQTLAFSTGQPVNQPLVVKGRIGAMSYVLLRNGQPNPTALSDCGITLDTTNGALVSTSAKTCSVSGIGVAVSDAGAGGAPAAATTLGGMTVTSTLATVANTCYNLSLSGTTATMTFAVPVVADYFELNWNYYSSSGGNIVTTSYGIDPGSVNLGSNVGDQGRGNGTAGWSAYGTAGKAYRQFNFTLSGSGTQVLTNVRATYGNVYGSRC